MMPRTGSTCTHVTCVSSTAIMGKVAQVWVAPFIILPSYTAPILNLHHRSWISYIALKWSSLRAGAMVASLLLRIGACSTSSEALQLFANRRTGIDLAFYTWVHIVAPIRLFDLFLKYQLMFISVDGKVVVKHPSQLRYVALYDQFRRGELLFSDHYTDSEAIDVLKIDGRGLFWMITWLVVTLPAGIGDASIEKNIPRIITGIRLSSAPQFHRWMLPSSKQLQIILTSKTNRGGCSPWFSIDQKGKRIFFSPPLKGVKSTESVYFSALRIIVEGDIRLDFYHKDFKTVWL